MNRRSWSSIKRYKRVTTFSVKAEGSGEGEVLKLVRTLTSRKEVGSKGCRIGKKKRALPISGYVYISKGNTGEAELKSLDSLSRERGGVCKKTY